MIPYSDLVAALRSWRERNGLPNFGVDPGASPSTMAAPAAAPSLPGPPPGTGLQTRAVPPTPPPGAGGSTIEVAEEIDAQEIESEEIYDNEGGDFAMAFGSNIQVATEPGAQPDGGGYGGYGGGDDDFAAEPAPSTGTQPGVEPPGKKPGKKR